MLAFLNKFLIYFIHFQYILNTINLLHLSNTKFR